MSRTHASYKVTKYIKYTKKYTSTEWTRYNICHFLDVSDFSPTRFGRATLLPRISDFHDLFKE